MLNFRVLESSTSMLIYKFCLYVNTNVTFSHVGIDGGFVKGETPEMGALVVFYMN